MLPHTAVLAVVLGMCVGGVRAGSPSPSVLEYNRSTGRFRIARINAGPGPQTGPSGIEQVVRSVFDPLTNAIRVYAAPNPPGQAVKPTSSDQVFTSIFNGSSNALQVKCVAGCGSSGGSVALSMPPEFVVTTGSGTITVAKATQTANSFYAGPLSGSAAPAFRSLVPADLPAATGSSQGAIQLAGDLGGSATAPKIVSLAGNAISATAPSANQVLTWNGSASQWAPSTLPAAPVSSFNSRTGAIVPAVGDYSFTQISGGLACTQHPALTGDVTTSAGSCATTVAQIQGYPVSSAVPSSNQVLEWVSGAWTPATLAAPPITSVFGRTGTVTPAANDYSFSQISGSVAPGQLPAPTATALGGVESLAASASKWINAISTTGAPSASQPAFTDISGSLACGQLPAMTGGDVTSSAGSCATTVAATHLSSPLPIAQGGNGTASPGITAGANISVGGSWPFQSVAFSGALAATAATISHQWLASYNASTGAFTQSQPAFADLSGVIAASQIAASPITNDCPQYNGTTLIWVACGGTPSGSSGAIEYNASGSFGGFGSWNGSLLQLPAGSSIGSANLGSPALTFGDNAINVNVPMNVSGGGTGLGFTAQTDPTCSSGSYQLWASLSASRLKQCNNGTVSQFVASGVDVNTSDQVVGTHLSSPLPGSQGGTGVNSTATFPTSGTVATASGTPAVGHCASWASSTSLQDSGAACGGGSSLASFMFPGQVQVTWGATGTTRYFPLLVSTTGNATQTPSYSTPIAVSGTISNFFVQLGVAPGGSATIQVTLVCALNSQTCTPGATPMTCTVASGSTNCSDTTHTFAITKGDNLDIVTLTGGSGTPAAGYISTGFTVTGAN